MSFDKPDENIKKVNKLEKIKNLSTGIAGGAVVGAGIATANPLLAIGGATVVFGSIMNPIINGWRNKWFDDLYTDFKKLEGKVDGFNWEEQLKKPEVAGVLIETTLSAIKTANEEKRELLRNAVLNIALGTNIEEDIRAIILRLIDEMSPTHVKILRYFENPQKCCDEKKVNYASITATGDGALLLKAYPEFGDGKSGIFFKDLQNGGLLPTGEWLNVMGGNFLKPKITNLGKQFLQLVTSPLN